MKITILLATLLLLFTSSSTQAIDVPPEFTAYYKIKKAFFTLGEATRSLRKLDATHYEYTSVSNTAGIVSFFASEHIKETSRFTFDGQQVRPLQYHFNREGNKNRIVTQHFNWDTATVNSQVDNESFVYSIPANTLDQSVYQFGLMMDLANGKRKMQYQLAANKKLKTYPIKHLRNERITTQLGEFDTVVVQRIYKKLTTTLWCAKTLYFLPVRIEHNENGSNFTATLERLEGINIPKATLTPTQQTVDEEYEYLW